MTSLSGLKLQDVAKKGLKYGDEDEDAQEKAELEMQKKAYRPLLEWLKKELQGQIGDGSSIRYDWSTPCSHTLPIQLFSRIDLSSRPAQSLLVSECRDCMYQTS